VHAQIAGQLPDGRQFSTCGEGALSHGLPQAEDDLLFEGLRAVEVDPDHETTVSDSDTERQSRDCAAELPLDENVA
jgi:hypothetical protein